MAITLDSLLKNKKAVSKEVPYNTEKMAYAVRLPESIKQEIIRKRVEDKMHICHIAEAMQISDASIRKVLIQAGVPTGNINNRKD